jgi:hypothetical protein
MGPCELLPRVDVYRLSDHMREEFRTLVSEAVRSALAELGNRPAGALRGHDAARYLGLGRSRFYMVLKEHPELLAASFTVGKARMWQILLQKSVAVSREP